MKIRAFQLWHKDELPNISMCELTKTEDGETDVSFKTRSIRLWVNREDRKWYMKSKTSLSLPETLDIKENDGYHTYCYLGPQSKAHDMRNAPHLYPDTRNGTPLYLEGLEGFSGRRKFMGLCVSEVTGEDIRKALLRDTKGILRGTPAIISAFRELSSEKPGENHWEQICYALCQVTWLGLTGEREKPSRYTQKSQ